MERNLRKLRLFDEASRLCNLVWQGDFGTGQSTGSGVFGELGGNPCKLYQLPTSTGSGIPQPQFRVGMVTNGDLGSEFVYAKLTLAAVTDILPGQVYELDENFNATLLTTANSVLNAEIGVLNVWAPQTAVGTYYIWLQRAGRCSIQAAAGSIATGQAETTATAGQVKFLNAHTAGSKSSQGAANAYLASSGVTFTGNTTNGSPYITNVVSAISGGAITDLQLGQVITGANLPANAIIAAIDKVGGQWRITIGTNTAGSYSTLQNATATASGTTFTVTSHVTANLYWPTLNVQN